MLFVGCNAVAMTDFIKGYDLDDCVFLSLLGSRIRISGAMACSCSIEESHPAPRDLAGIAFSPHE